MKAKSILSILGIGVVASSPSFGATVADLPQVSGSPRESATAPVNFRGSSDSPDRGPTTVNHHGDVDRPANDHSNRRAPDHNGSTRDSKGVLPPEAAVAEAPKLHVTTEAGYASKYVWRGVDLVQFTSYNAYNNGVPGNTKMSTPQGDVYYLGMGATYNGWAFGVKYVESLSHDFNPFFAQNIDTKDAYSEYIFSANYTYALLPDRWLNATAGFDFYYYPNGEFWGVDHQGLAYLKLVSPHYQWAQPFINLFYNVPTTSQGNGLAASNGSSFRKGLDGGNVTGAKLVEGCGFELGAAGGGEVARTGDVGYGVSYSLSTTYKNGYAYEPDGFSHITASLSAPVTIGQNLTIAPSVNYVHALKSIDSPGAGAWNYPGWWYGIKATYSF
jgi:hypothetical protein